jgi:hypothetical protein
MKKIFLTGLAIILIAAVGFSQSCQVNVESLKGEYLGDCKKGKANGIGNAFGIDMYAGEFKNGYPDGQGKYTWKNGSWYDGSWKNGLFEGRGTLNKIWSGDSSVILSGYWKKGKFVGKNEKPYIVNVMTNNISDINVRRLNGLEPEITIIVKNITGGATTFNAKVLLPKSRLVEIQTLQGRFEQEADDETSSLVSNKYILRKVTFPFTAILSFQTPGTKLQVERVQVEFLENSNWYVQVSIDN